MRWAIDEDVEESDLREKMDLASFVEKYLYLQDWGALACCYQGWPKFNCIINELLVVKIKLKVII